MLIGELSARTGFSRDCIRYYEKIGLLTDGQKVRLANNYKDYGPEAVERLVRIGQLKNHGFTLSEIRDLIAHVEQMENCSDVPDVLRTKIADIDEQLALLQIYRERLVRTLEACEGRACRPDTDHGSEAVE